MTRIINSLAIIIISLLQVSFLVTWPKPISTINLILVLVIFLIALANYQRGLWWAFGGGLLLELSSFELFGGQVLSLLLTAVIINFLFTNFFTNYSFYSLTVLGVIGTLAYNFLIFLIQLGGIFLGLTTKVISLSRIFFLNLGWQIFFHLIILYILFFIFHFLIGRLRLNLTGSDPLSVFPPPAS